MSFTDFDFGVDVGGEAGFDPTFDPFADEFAGGDSEGWQDAGAVDYSQMTPEQAQEAIAAAMAEEQAMGGDTPITDMVDQQVAEAMATQSEMPTDAAASYEPVEGIPSEVSPAQRVDDAFFDMGGQPTAQAADPTATAQEMIRDAMRQQQTTEAQLQQLGQGRMREMGPPAPEAPEAPRVASEQEPKQDFREQEAARGRSGTRDTLGQRPTQTGRQLPEWTGRAAGSVAPRVRQAIQEAAAVSGVSRIEVTSGARGGPGEPRHGGGNAADLRLYQGNRVLNSNNPADRQVMSNFIRESRARGMIGIGHHGQGYMGPEKLHVGAGRGADVAWGLGGRSAGAPSWVTQAFNEGRGARPTPLGNIVAPPPAQFADAMPRLDTPASTMIAEATPLPRARPADAPSQMQPAAPTIAGYAREHDFDMAAALANPDQQRLAEAFDAFRGQQVADTGLTESMLRRAQAFGPEDVSPEPVDPSTLPPPDARITVRPQRGDTYGVPGAGGPTETEATPDVEGPPTELPEIVVTPPGDIAPGTVTDTPSGDTPPTYYPEGTAQPGPGQYDTGAAPSDSPSSDARRLAEQQRDIDRRQEQRRRAGEQRPPQSPIGAPRAPVGEMNYPVSPADVPPQSVLRTDVRPEPVPDIRKLLEETARPIDTGRLAPMPALPGVAAGQGAAQVAGDIARGVGQEAWQTAEDLGNLFNPDPGAGRSPEQRTRSAFAIPGMVAGGPLTSLGATAATRALSGAGIGTGILFPDVAQNLIPEAAGAGVRGAARIPGAIAGAVPNVTGDEIMGIFSALGPSAAYAETARKSGAQGRNAKKRNERIRDLQKQGMTLNANDEVVPLPAPGEPVPPGVVADIVGQFPHHIRGAMGPQPGASDYRTLGVLAGGTAALIFGPRLARRFLLGDVPKLPTVSGRPVTNAPPGTLDYNIPTDVTKMMTYEANAPVTDSLSRAVATLGAQNATGQIVPLQAVREIERLGAAQTRGAARALAESAIRYGEMHNASHSFRVSHPLEALGKEIGNGQDRLDFNRYITFLNIKEEIKVNSVSNKNMKQGITPTARGVDLATAQQHINQLEAINPRLPIWADVYAENLKETRRFISTGEDATMSRFEANDLNRTRPHEIYMSRRTREGQDWVDHGNVLDILADTMRVKLRERMQNTYNGSVARVSMRTDSGHLYVPTEPGQPRRTIGMDKDEFRAYVKAHPSHEAQAINIPNRGVDRYYFGGQTLVDAMKHDPEVLPGMTESLVHASTRAFQAGTTAAFAPWFATRNAMRTWWQLKHSMPGGGPSIVQTIGAVEQRLNAQMSKYFSEALDRNVNGWFGSVIGPNNVQRMAQSLHNEWMNSTYRLMEVHGGTAGGIMHNNIAKINLFRKEYNLGVSKMHNQSWWRTIGDSYMGLMESVHGSAQYAAFVKGVRRGMSPTDAAIESRIAASDTRISGVGRTQSRPTVLGGREEIGGGPIRYDIGPPLPDTATRGERAARFVEETRAGVPMAAGALGSLARQHIPWANPMMQGPRRIAEAWMNNPAMFTAKLWMYTLAPAAGSYTWNMMLGTDPNGISYNDYQMNMRSEDASFMRLYFGLPGQPVEKGVELDLLHELALPSRLMQSALHHLTKSDSRMFTEQQDLDRAAASFGRNVMWPANPVWMNLAFASVGMRGFGGIFSGDAYRPRVDPFDPSGGPAHSYELYARALAGGIGEITAAGYASAMYPEQTIYERLTHAAQTMGRRIVEKDTVVSALTGLRPPMSGTTPVSNFVFEKNKQLADLLRFHSASSNIVGTKAATKGGEEMIFNMLDPTHPLPQARQVFGIEMPNMGRPVLPPTNPLYVGLIGGLREDLIRDKVALKSAWDFHADMTKQINALRQVNEGSAAAWQRQLQSNEKTMKYLRDNKVDHTDRNEVMNFFTKQREDIRRVMRGIFIGTENKLTQRAKENPLLSAVMQQRGLKRITFKDLHPYGAGGEVEDTPTANDWTLP